MMTLILAHSLVYKINSAMQNSQSARFEFNVAEYPVEAIAKAVEILNRDDTLLAMADAHPGDKRDTLILVDKWAF